MQRPAGSRRSQKETRSSEYHHAASEQRQQKTRRLERASGAEVRCNEISMPFDQKCPSQKQRVHEQYTFLPRKPLIPRERDSIFCAAFQRHLPAYHTARSGSMMLTASQTAALSQGV